MQLIAFCSILLLYLRFFVTLLIKSKWSTTKACSQSLRITTYILPDTYEGTPWKVVVMLLSSCKSLSCDTLLIDGLTQWVTRRTPPRLHAVMICDTMESTWSLTSANSIRRHTLYSSQTFNTAALYPCTVIQWSPAVWVFKLLYI